MYDERERKHRDKLTKLSNTLKDVKQEIPELLHQLEENSSLWDDHEDEGFTHSAKVLNAEQLRMAKELDALEKQCFELKKKLLVDESKHQNDAHLNCIDLQIEVEGLVA